jgi:ABC-type branched-subunit amino acid transport system ATPase component
VRAVNGASIDVDRGTITGLIGPNGAGKSTALAIIAGELKPTSGTVTFDGVDVTGMPAYKRARRGLIRTFQLSGDFPKLTALENVLAAAPGQHGESYGGALFAQRRWKRQQECLVDEARGLLERFELSEKESDYAANLSGGQKRLLQLARAIMAKPALLLLDEPMAGVNPAIARRIEQHLVELRDSGLTILLVEHELGVVERLCDKTIVMAEGRVISEGTMAALRSHEEVLDAYLGR